MAALAQSDDAALLAWATEALAKATGVRGEADIARHLLAQTTMEAVDEAARGLLGATPAVAAFARELRQHIMEAAATVVVLSDDEDEDDEGDKPTNKAQSSHAGRGGATAA